MRLKRRQNQIAIPWTILILVLCIIGRAQIKADNGNENAIEGDGISATGTEDQVHNGLAGDEDEYDDDDDEKENDDDQVLDANNSETTVDCSQAEYSQYRECVDAHTKHSPSPSDDRTIVDYCVKLNADCVQTCDGNAVCETDCPVCPLNADKLAADSLVHHRLPSNCNEATAKCLAACTATACRIDCFKQGCSAEGNANVTSDATNNGIYTVIVHQENGNGSIPLVHRFGRKLFPGQNVTSVIRLTNIVNNTNRIEAPVNITTTDLDGTPSLVSNDTREQINATVPPAEESSTGGKFGFGYSKTGPCCIAIRPKSCRASSNGLRCHHRRHRTCGSQICVSRTIHVQLRQRCNHHGQHGCKHGIAYIPQPQAPKCIYIDQWPFVSCTVAFERQFIENNCNGCYDHYGYGFRQYHANAEHHRIRCRGCFADAFEIGPLYRRGPLFRPYFYHRAPCYVTGSCRGYELSHVNCGRYGCFDDELVDPVWGHRPKRPRTEQDFYEDDGYSKEQQRPSTKLPPHRNVQPTAAASSLQRTNQTSTSLDSHIHKCSVVSDDGTIEVKNCTDTNLETNPYAASPANDDELPEKDDPDDIDEPYPIEYEDGDDAINDDDEERPEESIRIARSHAKRKHAPLVYDDFDDDLNGLESANINRQRYAYEKRLSKKRRIRKRSQRPRRQFRIVYDDVDAGDYE